MARSPEVEIVPDEALSARIERLRRFSTLLDSAAPIPGTPFRVGLDSLIGLLPGIGDSFGILASTYIILEAARIGTSKRVLLQMGRNTLIDGLVGAIPLLGDLFDVAWKANSKNIALLEREASRGKLRARTSEEVRSLLLWIIGIGVFTAVIGVTVLVVLIFKLLFGSGV